MSPVNKTAIVCVIDTECCFKNTKSDKLIFHFGACIGNVHQEHSFDVVKMDYYVKEVLEEINNFFFVNKATNTPYAINSTMRHAWKDALQNPHKVKPWAEIVNELDNKIKAMGVQYITSYNFNFDIGVGDKHGTIRRTHQQLTDKTFYLPRGVEHFCLMDVVAHKMANRDFMTWIDGLDDIEKNQMTTEKGNLSYSAECMVRYLTKDLFYIEQHTALRDAMLEFKLAMHCFKHYEADIKKHFLGNVKSVSWQSFNKGLSSLAKMKLRNEPKGKKATPKKVVKTERKQGELF